jgi:aspartyl-tRNA(Asn)/glutamyl-tRNA(Gln) amidotransferase subunit B
MEEDAGKLIHQPDSSLVDFNRTGIPLLEIVSEPDIRSPEEAYEYLTALKSIIQYLDVSDCDMEKGSLRCDANISLRPKGSKDLGVKTELKNMNSFKGVKDALTYEVNRQTEILEKKEEIIQETRLWDVKALETVAMRTKEGAKDYRYFPEPDLPPFIIKEDKISEIRKCIPELPNDKLKRFVKDYGLTEYDARILVATKADSQFSEDCIKAYPKSEKKPIVNWLIGPLMSEANSRSLSLSELKVDINNLLSLIAFVEKDEISHLSAKNVLNEMINTGKKADLVIKEKNLIQISDAGELVSVIDEVIRENPKSVADYKSGKSNAIMFLVGQIMRKSKGKANPKTVQDLLKERLESA